MEWQTTSTILRGLADFDDRDVWLRLSNRFRRPIVRFARQMGLSQADAEDVGQEALLSFAESYRKGQYDPAKGRLSKWLFGIAYRQIQNHRRRAARRDVQVGSTAQDTDFWDRLPDEQEATNSWDVEWERALLEQCLEQVRGEVEPETFHAFQAVVAQERSASEAAELVGIPVKAVYNAKHRILKRIRQLRDEFEGVE